jgi:molecular chaperone GrpE
VQSIDPKSNKVVENDRPPEERIRGDGDHPGTGAEQLEAEADQQEIFDPDEADRDTLLKKYRELEDKLSESQEQVLRALAESENFKKRIEREKQEQTRYANETFMRSLLPVLDNLERALDHSGPHENNEGLVEGLNMTLKGFKDALVSFGCTPLEALHEVFDPNFHEAVSQEETADHPAHTVVKELQKGYMLKDRLLRPAMVVVSKSPAEGAEGSQRMSAVGGDKTDKGEVKIEVKKG